MLDLLLGFVTLLIQKKYNLVIYQAAKIIQSYSEQLLFTTYLL